MLLKRQSSDVQAKDPSQVSPSPWIAQLKRGLTHALPTVDRRAFLRRSGLGLGLGVGAGLIGSQLRLVQKADAAGTLAPGAPGSKGVVTRRTVCTHCSVGCASDAMVENGVWVRQNPVFESPINLGAHCAKGAALRDHGRGDHRLRYPMKLVDGKYQSISWDQAL
ncbi:MAG: formate dehydrogenase, partial [Thiomonas sp.]